MENIIQKLRIILSIDDFQSLRAATALAALIVVPGSNTGDFYNMAILLGTDRESIPRQRYIPQPSEMAMYNMCIGELTGRLRRYTIWIKNLKSFSIVGINTDQLAEWAAAYIPKNIITTTPIIEPTLTRPPEHPAVIAWCSIQKHEFENLFYRLCSFV